MRLRTFLFTATLATLPSAAAWAVDQVVIDEITDALVAEGYTQLRLRHGPGWADVEAVGPQGTVLRRYDADGDMLRERLYTSDGLADDTALPRQSDRTPTNASTTPARDQLRSQTRNQSRDETTARDQIRSQARTETRTRVQATDQSCDGSCSDGQTQARNRAQTANRALATRANN